MSTETAYHDYPLLDETAFAEARSIFQEKFPQMLIFYLEDMEAYIEKMERALAENNAAALVPPAHTAKSSSRQMGVLRLSEIADFMERTGRAALKGEMGLHAMPHRLEDMRATLAETQKEIGLQLG